MSDYWGSLNTSDYLYKKPVYFTESAGVDRSYSILRLTLTPDNFNFSTAQSTGNDFRLARSSSGNGVFNMWKAYWNAIQQSATLFFKVPDIYAGQSYTYYAFWGSLSASGISDPDEMGFIFYYSFMESPIDTSIWAGYTSGSFSYNGYRIDGDVYTKTAPMSGHRSWVLEAGFYLDSYNTGWKNNYYAGGINFLNSTNGFGVRYYYGYDQIGHNIEDSSATYVALDVTSGTLEPDSNNNFLLGYIAVFESKFNRVFIFYGVGLYRIIL